MQADRVVSADLGDGMIVKVEALDLGGQSELVGDAGDIISPFATVADSIEAVTGRVFDAVKKAGPQKTTIELQFGIGVESGKLFAVIAKGSATASMKVTLEWNGT